MTEVSTEKSVSQSTEIIEDDFPDGGLEAWLVVVAFFFCTASSWGLANTFGIFQTYYTSPEGPLSTTSASAVSWIGSLQTFFIFAPGFLVGRLVDAGYVRSLVVYGTLIMTFSMMMTSISTQYWHFFLAQGVGFGMGLCTLFLPAVTVCSHWFKRRRALAMGIGASGSSIGGIWYPIMLNKLIPKIGFGWAVRATTFVMLATQIIAIIFLKPRLPPRPIRGQQFFDLQSFKEPVYLLLCLGFFLGFAGLYTPFYYVQDFALYHGISDSIAIYLLPILNAASTFGRILPNLLADVFGCLNVVIPCVSISGVMILAWIGCTHLSTVIVFVILFGFFSGAFVSMPPPTVAAITKDPKKIGVRVGQSFTIVSLAALVGPPISGALLGRNDFVKPSIFAGVIVISGGITLTLAKFAYSRNWRTKI